MDNEKERPITDFTDRELAQEALAFAHFVKDSIYHGASYLLELEALEKRVAILKARLLSTKPDEAE